MKWFLCCVLALVSSVAWADNAIEQVNRQRAAKGLPPFINDPGLQQAAEACCNYRAKNCIEGHCNNDFQFVPAGTYCPVAGCAAWRWDGTFGACALYDNYRYAGCAWYMGRDGRCYMHAFYSNTPSAVPVSK